MTEEETPALNQDMTEEENGANKEENGANKEEENSADKEDETDVEDAIISQVEYYFSDSNLPRDKFLREQVKLDEGWVPLEVLTRFNRLAKLTTDISVIANALQKSTSGLLEVSEDSKKVRRNPELPVPEMNEDRRKELQGRTIYAKGFGKETVLDEVLKYFKQHGNVENVIMRRYQEGKTKKRLFKGSVFVTFQLKEEAEKFINTKGVKFGETELIVRWQDEYLKQKQEEYEARKQKKEKKTKTEDVKTDSKDDIKLPTGTVLYFSEGNDKMTRENIKEVLTPLGAEIAYIDFKVGDKEGWVRLTKEDSAKELIAKLTDQKASINDAEVTFKLLEGDEEKAYLEKTVDEMSKRRKNMRNNKHNRGNRNFKGKQQGRKRKQGDHTDAPTQKVKAQ